jgi:peptidoglycan/LPS O-acetylase OafA/YrhL/4-amino-4-deoxy-L-arabinose transferase-like glycosyltransferase
MLFFGLTGYLLFWPWAKGAAVDLRTYCRNRVLRIVPLYLAAVAILLVIGEGGGSLHQWLAFPTFTANFFSDTVATVDAPLWSVIVEAHFYLLLPLLAAGLVRLRRRNALGAGSLALWFAKVGAADHVDLRWRYSLPVTFHWFVPGMLLALLAAQWREDGRPAWLRGALAAPALWMGAAVALWLVGVQRLELNPIVCLATFLAIGGCVLALEDGAVLRVLDWRPLALLGVASYSIYVWHWPIVDGLREHGIGQSSRLLGLGFVLTLGAAIASYRLVEAPFLRLRRRWAPTAGPGAAAPPDPATAGPRRWWQRIEPTRNLALAVLGVALVLRVAVVLGQPGLLAAGDAGDYLRHGLSIAAGHGYPDTVLGAPGTPTGIRPPGYPYLLGGVLAVTGDSETAGRLFGALLGTLVVLLIGLIARRVWGPRVGLLAAALAAISPPLVFATASFISEALFLPLVLGFVHLVLRARDGERPSLPLAAAAGAVCGLAALTRFIGIALLALLVVALWQRRAGWRALRAPAAGIVAALVVMAPWTARNASAFHTFVPVATEGGFSLYGTYNAFSDGRKDPPANYQLPPYVPDAAPLFHRAGWDEARIDAELGRRGRDYMLDHPGYVAEVVFWSTARLTTLAYQPLSAIDYAQIGVPGRWRGVLETWVLASILLAGWGAWLLWRRRAPRAPWFLWLAPLILAAPPALFLSVPRYRLPLDLFLTMLAAVALVHGARGPATRR